MPKGIPKNGINRGWFKKDRTPWNKDKKEVQKGWSKGLTKEDNTSIKETSYKLTGRKLNKKHRENISKSHLGYKMPAKQRKKISSSVKELYKDDFFKRCQKEGMNKEETKKKCATPHIGRKHSEEEKKKRQLNLKEHYLQYPETKNRTKHIGKDNGMWNEGSSFYPYSSDWNSELKEKIKERDGYKCVLCSLKKDLVIHHIDYDKLNSSEDNLVTLCSSCHGKTNVNRKVWIRYFNSYIKKNRK